MRENLGSRHSVSLERRMKRSGTKQEVLKSTLILVFTSKYLSHSDIASPTHVASASLQAWEPYLLAVE